MYSLEEALGGVMKTLKKHFKITRRGAFKSMEYDGVELTHNSITSNSGNIKDDISEEGLKYHRERGRTALETLLGCLFRLGYQSGYLDAKEESETLKFIISVQKNTIKSLEDKIKSLEK